MKFLVSAVFGWLLSAAVIAAPALNNPTSEVIAESSTGVVIAVEIPDATLSVLDRGEGGDAVQVEIPGAVPNFDGRGIVVPTITKLLSVPAGYKAVVRSTSIDVRDYSVEALVPRDRLERTLRETSEEPSIEVGDPVWIRWMRVAPVVIRPARYDAASNTVQVTRRMELEFEFIRDESDHAAPLDPARYWSQDYDDFFKSMLLNPPQVDNITPGGQVVTRGSYLIITDSTLSNFTTPFAEWKRAKGFNVVVAPIAVRGVTADQIRAYITNAYENWERPPEYVLLLGDVHIIPTFQIHNPSPQYNENDCTDLPYSLMQGEDYFPDLQIGRVSSDSPTPTIAQNYLARLIRHERDALAFPAEAFNRAVVFAGNRGDNGAVVLSPVETAEWLATRLREYGYDVYTQMWREVGDNDDPAPIVEAINRGVNIVAYRGWADSHGTHYPRFYTENLDQLNNGPLLPPFTFFVCNTGDFDNENRALCFGEYAICRGSRQNPTGAIGFYGPSDLHTKTTFNNSMLAGYYVGLMHQNMRVFGELTLRAKMEVWATNPHLRVMGGDNYYVEFYFSVYNNLGDPEATVYFHRPEPLTVTFPERMSVGETSARFVVRNQAGAPVERAMITLLKGNETNLSILTDADGVALANVNLDSPDTLRVLVQAKQFGPKQIKIPVAASNRLVGYESVELRENQIQDKLNVGSAVNLVVRLRNFGSATATSVNARLSSPLEGVDILQAESNYGDIAAGAVATSQTDFRVLVSPAYNNNAGIPFILNIRDSQGELPPALFRVNVANGMIAYKGHRFESDYLNPGATENFIVTVENWGALPVNGLQATLECFDDAVEIIDNTADFDVIEVGATVDCAESPFRLHLREGTFIGRQLPMRLHLADGSGVVIESQFFPVTVGNPGPTDPVGPDGYGYYAYDNVDENYDRHPTYNWIELDPGFGGGGATMRTLNDDQTFVVDLPFRFRFYGADYSSLSVCSNGWASFEGSQVWDFNNWPIGSPLGPHTMLCPFWEDLVGHQPEGDPLPPRESMKVFYRYDEADHRFIVEWSRVIARSGNQVENIETFEIILFDPRFVQTPTGDGEILFQYQEVHIVDQGRIPYDYATIGIQDWNHQRGIGLSFANIHNPAAAEFTGGRAILFTTFTPDDYLDAGKKDNTIPTAFRLGEAFPNPFNSRTAIEFAVPNAGELTAAIYDLSGRWLMNVGAGQYQAGTHSLEFDAGNLSSGMYLLRVEIGGFSGQRKITLLK